VPTIRFRGTRAEFKAALRRALDDPAAPAQRAAAGELLKLVRDDYELKALGGTGADGTAWAANTPATVKRKGGRKRIGFDKGLLFLSLSPGVPTNVFRMEGREAVVGTDLSYASHFARKRAIFPKPGRWPRAWLARLAAAARDVLVKAVAGQG
jgi:hypothetical protein